MNEKFTVRKANENDMPGIQNMIKGLAEYEKRPQDMTASQEDLCHWIFEKKIATALIAEYNNEAIGYAIYFGSFAAEAGVHLEDMFLNEKYRPFVFIIKLALCRNRAENNFATSVNKFQFAGMTESLRSTNKAFLQSLQCNIRNYLFSKKRSRFSL